MPRNRARLFATDSPSTEGTVYLPVPFCLMLFYFDPFPIDRHCLTHLVFQVCRACTFSGIGLYFSRVSVFPSPSHTRPRHVHLMRTYRKFAVSTLAPFFAEVLPQCRTSIFPLIVVNPLQRVAWAAPVRG
ncbi:hypothetical protein PLICRDRAFT_39823 [Plicaturopsis crispa FD-325 SS-3]|nr:hypothetical protein PLICRDRAFT_39823 [Plicaturopsis crispa FD-325 SS-3]